ncbi:hypothetical protein ADK53_28700 [Streptomyces sp. WM6373]|uniref:hypothetical protein n=1 Tax=Streptomyces sp. WM6373 TaxID=1415556 RepID=UPI0006B03982|nr:hypothetical protein [Streptomyces sp. WM6373]KOU30200.1 hypothetical protein ADK53_28700 [Streptomyces sp. WM6373]
MPKPMTVTPNTRFETGARIGWDIDIVTAADAQIPASGELVGCGQTVREVLADLRVKAARQLGLPNKQVEITGYQFYRH